MKKGTPKVRFPMWGGWIFIFLLVRLTLGFTGFDKPNDFTDIDGNIYKTVKIGEQEWMAENLRVTRDRNGNPIKSFCFNNDESNCKRYGRLYTWDVALKVSPKGWHLPTVEEWESLVNHLGGEDVAGEKVLEGGSSGFNALLAGGADFRGNYLYMGIHAIFWTSTEASEERAYHQGFRKDGKGDLFAAMKGARISVRLVKD